MELPSDYFLMQLIEASRHGFYSNVRQPTARPALRRRPSRGFFGSAAGKALDPRGSCYAAFMDKPQDTPTLPGYYRHKAAEARQAAEERQRERSRSGCTARLAISMSWPMPLTEQDK